MKKTSTITLLLILFALAAKAQNLNWARLQAPPGHLLSLQVGYDHAFATNLGYACRPLEALPMILQTSVSLPVGRNLVDDWKWKVGGRYALIQGERWKLVAKADVLLRRHKTDFDRLLGMGTDLGLTVGRYAEKLFWAVEAGYDRTWALHVKHGEGYRESYPEAVDGWYRGKAGNFYFGVLGGFSWEKVDLNLRLGQALRPASEGNLIPWYMSLGFNFRI